MMASAEAKWRVRHVSILSGADPGARSSKDAATSPFGWMHEACSITADNWLPRRGKSMPEKNTRCDRGCVLTVMLSFGSSRAIEKSLSLNLRSCRTIPEAKASGANLRSRACASARLHACPPGGSDSMRERPPSNIVLSIETDMLTNKSPFGHGDPKTGIPSPGTNSTSPSAEGLPKDTRSVRPSKCAMSRDQPSCASSEVITTM